MTQKRCLFMQREKERSSDLKEADKQKDDTIRKLEVDFRASRKESGKEKKVYSIHNVEITLTDFCIVVIRHCH